MKSALILAIALCAVAIQAKLVLDDALIENINGVNAGWTAGRNKRFEGVSEEEVKHMLGYQFDKQSWLESVRSHAQFRPERFLEDSNDLPTSFDSRNQWPGCVHPIRDQAQCGSCWAFSASEALSDRFCIASNGSINVILSPQDLVSCDSGDMGCEGGYLNKAWKYMVEHGLRSDNCMPYTSGGGDSGECPGQDTCTASGQDPKKYYAQNSYHVWSLIEKERTIMKEIFANGPVQTGFKVYQDFMHYTDGVYKHTSGSLLGGHAVKIVGWGNEDGKNYWLVANSWSEEWGLQGFFKILRGKDECGIENDVYAGKAKAK